MAYNDFFRMSAHAVIVNAAREILLLKGTYGERAWSLPGGSLEPGETIHQALHRECVEEIGQAVTARYLSGVYYHRSHHSHVFIFCCDLLHPDQAIKLSSEHSEYRYFPLTELGPVQQRRVMDCLNFTGTVQSAAF